MNEEVIKLIVMLAAMTLGSAGAVMVFGIEKRAFWWAVLCVLLAAIGFELPRLFGVGLFLSSFISAAVAAAYSDVMAHWLKVPATVMLIPGIIPAVPGGRLYYTMLAAVNSDMDKFYEEGRGVLLITAGLAVGIVAVTAVSKPINAYISKKNQKKRGSV